MSGTPTPEEIRQLEKLLAEIRGKKGGAAARPGGPPPPFRAADPDARRQADLAKAVQVLQEAGLGHLLEPQPYRKRGAGRAAPVAAEPPATWLAGKPVCRHCLQPGDILTNRQLQDIFHCSPQGGMRRSRKTNSLVLISNHTQENYHDRWQDGCFHYTGMGLEGDQSLDFAQNQTLAESGKNGVEVYLFEVFHRGQYTFIGRVALAGEPYQEIQPDLHGQERKVWMFPLRILD